MVTPFDVWRQNTFHHFGEILQPLISPHNDHDRAIQKVVFQKLSTLGRLGSVTLIVIAIAHAIFNPANLAMVPFYYLLFESSNLLSNYSDRIIIPAEISWWKNWIPFRPAEEAHLVDLFKGAPVLEHICKHAITGKIVNYYITAKQFFIG